MSSRNGNRDEVAERRFDFEKQLRTVPVANLKAQVVDRDGDRSLTLGIALVYPGAVRPFARLLGLRDFKKYQIDGLSLEIWELLDGQRNIGDLVEILMERHRLTFFEARGLAVQVLGMLIKRGLAAAVVPRT